MSFAKDDAKDATDANDAVTVYNNIMPRLPGVLTRLVHEYVDPETTYIYTLVNNILVEFHHRNVRSTIPGWGRYVPSLSRTYVSPYTRKRLALSNMGNKQLFNRLTVMMELCPRLFDKLPVKRTNKTKQSTQFVDEYGKHFMERQIAQNMNRQYTTDWTRRECIIHPLSPAYVDIRAGFYVDRIEFVIAMILSGFEYKIVNKCVYFFARANRRAYDDSFKGNHFF